MQASMIQKKGEVKKEEKKEAGTSLSLIHSSSFLLFQNQKPQDLAAAERNPKPKYDTAI